MRNCPFCSVVLLTGSLALVIPSCSAESGRERQERSRLDPQQYQAFQREADEFIIKFIGDSKRTGVTDVAVDQSRWLVIVWDEYEWDRIYLADKNRLMRLVGANWQMVHKSTLGDDGWVKVVGAQTGRLLASAQGATVVINRD